MAHSHSHGNNNALNLAFWLNLIFSIIELIGGYLTNSTAITMDALHDFIDAMSIGMAVLLEKWSGKPASKQFSFGYKRFSLLSALLMSGFLLIGSVIMIKTAIVVLLNPEPVHSQGMFWLAVLGILVNGFAVFKIKAEIHSDEHEDGHEHAHKNNHAHESSHEHNHKDKDKDKDNHDKTATNKQSQNSKAIMLHLLEDLLGWLAVLVGAMVIYFTEWFWIDAVLAISIALFISYNALINLSETMKILLMAVPNDIDIEQLTADILAISDVQGVNKLRVWSIDGVDNMASVHIQVKGDVKINNASTTKAVEKNELMEQIKKLFLQYRIDDLTVQQF